MSNIYKVTVKKDNDGEFYIDLPDELMKSLDWKIGDELVWEETEVLGEEGEYPAAYVCKKVNIVDIPGFEGTMDELDNLVNK